jgi:hypothetical protein
MVTNDPGAADCRTFDRVVIEVDPVETGKGSSQCGLGRGNLHSVDYLLGRNLKHCLGDNKEVS